jgi:triacylglycerol esterase/lipase EstA (alpha/beta hydrolase family)
MAVRIPQNQIITNQYTSGGEYVLVGNQKEYQGYYYDINGKTFASKGKNEKSNPSDPEIIKKTSEKYNKLLDNPNTYVYGLISKVKINNFTPTSIPFNGDIKIRYFIKKINSNSIKEINEENFNKIKYDPIYQTLSIEFRYSITDEELNELDKKMPGIKAYLQNDINNIPSSSDETNSNIR